MGDEVRILDIWTGRPVSVENTRRCIRDLCDSNRKGGDEGAAMGHQGFEISNV